jgi:ribonuclease HI
MTNYFRQFIKNYSEIAKPLTRLTSPAVKFEMDQHAIEAFESLKQILTNHVTLAIVDFNKPFTLSTDASDIAIGAVLTQTDQNGGRPIYFFSRTLNEHERNYPTHERELLAIVAAIEEFETYLKGRKFTVKTDSQCLVYLFSDPHRNKRLVRQAINILDANFNVVYQPGKLNVVADALSRIQIDDTEQWDDVQNS